MLFNSALFAQQQEQDSIRGASFGKIELKNPSTILDAYTYDPVTDRYIYSSKHEDFNIRYPLFLTPEQYHELAIKDSMREYYRDKIKAVDGKAPEEKRRDLLPKYYVNSKFFELVFGSNVIDVKPTGSVEVDLGGRFTKQDNPAFSPRNRSNFTFDFDQRISMSLQGKVGTRLNVMANYDTQSTFTFQNQFKLDFKPNEDSILQKVEVGNVTFPLSNSLIRGAQSLFGAKLQLKFGNTTVTGVFSEQKSQTRSVTAQGGGTLTEFALFGLDYDNDRHYFLSQFFRNQYDEALKSYPYINSRVKITRIEVWVTNKQTVVNTTNNNVRNLIGIQDLGESRISNNRNVDITQRAVGVADQNIPNFFRGTPFNVPTDNKNNLFDPSLIGAGGLLNNAIRDIATVNNGFNAQVQVREGIDYSKLENARKLTETEFTYHEQLGYISLNQRLANDEVLAVAYQYTIGDKIYQVGEFGTDGIDATVVNPNGVPSSQNLVLKLLKSSLNSINEPTWDLMMKNIYQLPGAYQLSQEDFTLNILYTDPSPLNYISPAPAFSMTQPQVALPQGVADTPLIRVFGLDRLNYTNDIAPNGDGFFDFVPGITVDQQNGRIIFTSVEPFGSSLFEQLRTSPTEDYLAADENNVANYNANQRKYVYKSIYTKSQSLALQDSSKNKFQIKGRFKSAAGSGGIPLGAFNVPPGSVVVRAGGRVLVEGVDYTVNYQAGMVDILDPSLQNSSIPVEISLENNAVFGQQTRRFFGFDVEHKFSDKIKVGGTLLRMVERPFTVKSNYGQESVNNTIFGFNGIYSSEVPFLTRLVNKLPNVDTDVPSNISVRAEMAYLMPGASKQDQMNGEATIYIDDFEGSQNYIDLRSPQSWFIASPPINYGGEKPENDLSAGFRRAKLSWYTIDPIFYIDSQRPNGLSLRDVSNNKTRRIYSQEIYPNTNIVQGESTVVSTLDLTYYPNQRGPYNFNPAIDLSDESLANPRNNWGGIMRALSTPNFEQSNVEYIQFWMMDPYYSADPDGATSTTNNGKVVLNLGDVSEDILKDGRKFYENGLPSVGSTVPTHTSAWGKIPSSQSLIYAFDTDPANRAVQDIGLDGLTDAEEAALYPGFASLADPAGDNYQYFVEASGNVIERYKNYNGTQGNSPVNVSNNSRGSTTKPDVEDINGDNTLNTIEAYYKVEVEIAPNPTVGTNYVSDVVTTNGVRTPTGSENVRWVQYKIPIAEIAKDARNVIGDISDFRSIRFMRMFLTGFEEEITVRFGSLDLVTGQWRRYTSSLDYKDPNVNNDNTGFDVTTVSIEENFNKQPVNYVLPPGVVREQFNNNNTIINQNEQSLALKVYSYDGSPSGGLEPGDARAVFKNVSVDMRQYKNVRMFLHAESLPNRAALLDNQMAAFIRFGNDFTENFYEIQIPLKVTQPNERDPYRVWPLANEIEVPIELLSKVKILALQNNLPPDDDPNDGVAYVYDYQIDPSLGVRENATLIGIRGNPNVGLVRTLMIGVRNLSSTTIEGEIWADELRMSGLDKKGGWAAVASMDTNLADFASISATTRKSTSGFGGIEDGANERSREDMFQYNVLTNIGLGKLLPKKWGVHIPFNYSVGEETITPKYDPYYQDIELKSLLSITQDPAEKSRIENQAEDYTKRTSINVIGLRKDKNPEKKSQIYDVENFTLSHSHNEVYHRDFQIQERTDIQTRSSVDYVYAFPAVDAVEPFKKTKFMEKSKYWDLLRDFNLNYLPSSISFSSDVNRQYNRQQFRQVEVQGIEIDPLYRRNYFMNYTYGFSFDLTKSLRLNYNGTNNNLVRNYLDDNLNQIADYNVYHNYLDVGTANTHNQQLIVNYDLPINKIPVFSFVKSSYSYTSNFNWQRSPDAMSSIAYQGTTFDLGNTIQNSGAHRLNTTLTMDSFYKYIGLTKTKQPKKPTTPALPPKPGEKVTAQPQRLDNKRSFLSEKLIGIATSLKMLQVNYADNSGTVLPGYTPGLGFWGTTKPGLGFIFGSQSDIRYEMARNGYLTYYPEFNQSFTKVSNKTLNITGQLEILPDLKIDIYADRNINQNYTEQYEVTPQGIYNSLSPNSYGNFSISTVLIKTSFATSDENNSKTFDQFRENRMVMANRLAEEYYGPNIPRYGDANNPIPASTHPSYKFFVTNQGYPVGFGKNSQSVLIPSMLAAYSGGDAGSVKKGLFRDVPIPNWNVKYDGLMKFKYFQDTFRRFTVQHGYRASYTINNFRSNLDYDVNPSGQDNNGVGNFYNKTIVSNVNLAEQFNPLVKVEFELKNSFRFLGEVKRDRTLSLSLDNSLLTEVQGNEYIFGLGYRVKDVTINSRFAEANRGVIRSDLNIKGDISYRRASTFVRYLDYEYSELTAGQDIWSIRVSADYSFSRNLTALFYYDHTFSQAVISTTFPTTNIRAGLTLRYILGN
ncbi:cell surface protein SprA [Flavobacterium agricola]|uniref:Cell surface protein SprA n=1 Tax=Flavobacterium agricola TaxID=2870839 RepID=A0ABY6M442_9FLAO|nr:cell surface protein SprA [Flavobacterium agricola]